MRKFIISDIHGNGNIYYSVMKFLENINKEDDVELFINGDLIDRGEDSAEILLDVRNRILESKGFKINYLAGNHEHMMYRASLHRKNGVWPVFSDWNDNMGWVTSNALEELVSEEEENELIKFIFNLKIYHKFEETIDNKNIVLVHAKCPEFAMSYCDLKVKDDTREIRELVWTRKYDLWTVSKKYIGNEKYFTIIGHTPLNTDTGYDYDKKENVLNIDGGCSCFVLGDDKYDHSPLVEIDDDNNRLIILTFNNNNEIILGNYFQNKESIPMKEVELNKYRKYLNKNVKVKKFSVYKDEI